MQYFKGDDLEVKFVNCMKPIFDILSLQKSDFYLGGYETAPLGEMIYDTKRAPLSNAIARDIFRISFKQIFEAFVVSGTFDSYITVFRKIFGDTVEIEFTVPAPGKLNIDIVAEGFELSDFLSRYIEDNSYLFDEVIDYDDDNIAFQTVIGFTTQYELEQMLYEMVPAGIFTTITLDTGA